MSGFDLVRVDAGGGGPIRLPPGETVLGRGPLLGVSDKRVSRLHGLLENLDGELRLKPTHLNPCFVQASPTDDPRPLQRNSWHQLRHGDLFSLLPGRLIFQVEAVGGEGRTPRNGRLFVEGGLPLDPEPDVESPPSPAQEKEEEEEEAAGRSSDERDSERPNKVQRRGGGGDAPPSVSRRRVLPAWMTAAVAAPSSSSSPKATVKRSRGPPTSTQPAAAKKAPPTTASSPGEAELSEEEMPRKRRRNMSDEEEESARSKTVEKNPAHFQECSHPGDPDYEEEEEEEEAEEADRPECPYGTDCYRKNPLHRKEYKHTKRPARAARTAPGKPPAEEDEDEYEDSFIDDSSGDAGDDSDYAPPASDDSGREDVAALREEAKAFTRRRK
uniref:aprataxin and PNK-like factor n=1 Tax=Gasterosteus aculeatus aculeatus TaxID=481459 RepID=UPI001A9A0DD3|nr:aprataxin and PNK-like factor [Gasterosteus aculeatus aculeatus]